MSQALLVGLGGDLEGEVPDPELRGAEQGSGVGLPQKLNHLQQLAFDGDTELLGQLLGSDVLIGGQRFRHGILTEWIRRFLAQNVQAWFVYKNSTNFRDAHTTEHRLPLCN